VGVIAQPVVTILMPLVFDCHLWFQSQIVLGMSCRLLIKIACYETVFFRIPVLSSFINHLQPVHRLITASLVSRACRFHLRALSAIAGLARSPSAVVAFYLTDLAPDIVTSRREEQGLTSL